jgi:DNA-binding transcriptional regulator YiaG
MPNIGVLLKQEISRLCRREIRKEVAATKRASVAYRHDIAALKRKVGELERKAGQLTKQASAQAKNAPTPALPDRPVRFVAKGLRSLRTRLGVSAAQFARLVGVSEQSVYNWETKKATPRKEQMAAIIGMRGLGKRDAQERLQALAPRAAKTKKRAVTRKR